MTVLYHQFFLRYYTRDKLRGTTKILSVLKPSPLIQKGVSFSDVDAQPANQSEQSHKENVREDIYGLNMLLNRAQLFLWADLSVLSPIWTTQESRIKSSPTNGQAIKALPPLTSHSSLMAIGTFFQSQKKVIFSFMARSFKNAVGPKQKNLKNVLHF